LIISCRVHFAVSRLYQQQARCLKTIITTRKYTCFRTTLLLSDYYVRNISLDYQCNYTFCSCCSRCQR